MDRERKRPAWVILTNTEQSVLILYAQTTNHWFWQHAHPPPPIQQGLNLSLFIQASHPQLYIHMNSKHCPELAVSLRCPNPFLYCMAPVQNKQKHSARMLAGSVYTFQIIALTHRREHQKEATVIYMGRGVCIWLQSLLQKTSMEN